MLFDSRQAGEQRICRVCVQLVYIPGLSDDLEVEGADA